MTVNFTRVFTLPCDAPTAYRIFTADEHWRNSRIYGDIRWDGAPWTKGSVRHVEVLVPLMHKRTQSVQAAEAGKYFAILTHGLQYTTQTSMYFKETSSGDTEVNWNVEIAGESPDHGMNVEEFMEMFYQSMRTEADIILKKLQPSVA